MSLEWIAECATVGFFAVWCASLGKRQRRLDSLSLYDPMTGLLSGRVFTAERWPAALRASEPVALLMLDLDELKQKNAQGYAVGDRYIIDAARRLQRRRGVDQVFRLHSAGDEFVILVTGADALNAERFGAVLLEDLCAHELAASIGVAFTSCTDYRARAKVREQAEANLRQAKTRKASLVCSVVG